MDNTSLFFQIYNLNRTHPLLEKFMVFGATDLIYIIFLLVLILGIKGGIREKKSLLIIILGLPIAVLLIKIIHLIFRENRPFVDFSFRPLVMEKNDASFPSRHATISAVIAFSYLYFRSKWAIFFLFIMLWVGISRVFVGVHYPLDTIGGFATAVVSLGVALYVKNILRKYFLL